MKFFLGIDASLNRSAFVLIDEKGSFKKKWILKNTRGLKGEQRLSWTLRFLSNFLKRYGKYITRIGIENYSFGARGRAIFNIGESGGIIRLTLYSWSKRHNKLYLVFAPKTVKKFASGNGNANKQKMIESVKKKWNFDAGKDHDLADAFAVAQMTKAFFFFSQGNTKSFSVDELEVLNNIKGNDK